MNLDSQGSESCLSAPKWEVGDGAVVVVGAVVEIGGGGGDDDGHVEVDVEDVASWFEAVEG